MLTIDIATGVLQYAVQNPFTVAMLLLFAYYASWAVCSRTIHPLASIPGPFAASVTRLWYVRRVRAGKFDQEARALHQHYGMFLYPGRSMRPIS